MSLRTRLPILLLWFTSLQAQTAAPADPARLKELQDQINSLQLQLVRLQTEVTAMQSASLTSTAKPAAPQPIAPTAPPPVSQGTITRVAPLPATVQVTSKNQRASVGAGTSGYETFSDDPFAVARLYNVPLDPKYSGYFVLPGTETLMRIGGYFKTDMLYDLRNAGNPDQFVVSSIPNPQAGSRNSANISIRATRLNVDFRIPKSPAGDVRMYLEGDLFGTNATTPRLRHGYAQVANLLVGQTFTNFMDADTWPDTLDYEGPNSILNVRNPQLRYGFRIAEGTSVFLSAEKPSSDIATSLNSTSFTPSSTAPDGSARIRYEGTFGHVQLASIFRSVGGTLASGKELSTFGWGLSVSGLTKVYGRDNIVYQVAYGHGIGRYVSDASGLGLDAALRSKTSFDLTPLPIIAPYAAYQHYWAKRLRSSATFGYVQVQNTSDESASTFHKSTYSAGNIIFNPVGSLNVGAEFLYGWAEDVGGSRTNAPRFQITAKYSFVKIDSTHSQ